MHGKIIYLEGEPYLMTLPSGGMKQEDSDWNRMISTQPFERDSHWNKYSWVIDPDVAGTECSVRGGLSNENWTRFKATISAPNIGFRPVLTPLDIKTKQPLKVFESLPVGEIIRAGTLYMGGVALKNPAKNDSPLYRRRMELSIGDKLDTIDDQFLISWIVIGEKLIADRNLLYGISYDELYDLGIA